MRGERKGKVARREEVLRAALQIVDERGVHALTLRELSQRIGISEAAIFRHFRGKEDIISSLADWVFGRLAINEPAESDDVVAALANLMERQFRAFQAFPQSTSVLFQEDIFREFPQAKDKFDSRRKERARHIVGMLKEGKRNGQLPAGLSEDAFALIYMGSMRMAVLEWRSSGCRDDLAGMAFPIMSELSKILVRTASEGKGGG